MGSVRCALRFHNSTGTAVPRIALSSYPRRPHTDEVLRRALAEKERIFEGMREQSKREMAGGAHEKYSYT